MTDADAERSSGPVGVAAVVRFLLEVVAVGALGVWGYAVGGVPLALGAVVVVVVVWGALGAPAAPWRLSRPWRGVLELVVLGAATLALWRLGHPVLAGGFALVAALDTVALYGLGGS